METTEYIKPDDDDKELSRTRKYSEYFVEDVREEIVDEKEPQSNLVKHKCDICGKSYKSKNILTSHLKTHIESVNKKVKYLCHLCDYKAKRQGDLKKHIESVHEKVKHPCDLCEYEATTKYSLKTHIESVHEKVKYPCNLCGYKATQPGNLRTHIKSIHEKS